MVTSFLHLRCKAGVPTARVPHDDAGVSRGQTLCSELGPGLGYIEDTATQKVCRGPITVPILQTRNPGPSWGDEHLLADFGEFSAAGQGHGPGQRASDCVVTVGLTDQEQLGTRAPRAETPSYEA